MDHNRITLTGNICRDAEKRSEAAPVKFSVANNGKKDAPATFFTVELWGKLGETLQQYLKKGTKVLVSGRLKTSEYEKRDGGKGFELIVECNNFGDVSLLGGKEREYSDAAKAETDKAADLRREREAAALDRARASAQTSGADDLPF